MYEHAGALDVSQELHAEAGAFMRTFDKAWDIGDDEAVVLGVADFANGDDAEVRLKRGEGIIGDLRLGRADARDQSGFSNVRIPHDADVGEQLEFETQVAFFARASVFVLARGLVRRGGKVLIAASAAPAMGDDHTLIGLGEIVDQLAALEVIDHGSDGNFEHDVVPGLATAVGTFAVTSALRVVLRVETEVDERVVGLARFHDDVAATATVAAAGTATRDKLLPAEGNAPVAAVPGFYANFRFINEHSKPFSPRRHGGAEKTNDFRKSKARSKQ